MPKIFKILDKDRVLRLFACSLLTPSTWTGLLYARLSIKPQHLLLYFSPGDYYSDVLHHLFQSLGLWFFFFKVGKRYFEKRTVKIKGLGTYIFVIASFKKSQNTTWKTKINKKAQTQKKKKATINTNRTLQIISTDDTAEQLIW